MPFSIAVLNYRRLGVIDYIFFKCVLMFFLGVIYIYTYIWLYYICYTSNRESWGLPIPFMGCWCRATYSKASVWMIKLCISVLSRTHIWRVVYWITIIMSSLNCWVSLFWLRIQWISKVFVQDLAWHFLFHWAGKYEVQEPFGLVGRSTADLSCCDLTWKDWQLAMENHHVFSRSINY